MRRADADRLAPKAALRGRIARAAPEKQEPNPGGPPVKASGTPPAPKLPVGASRRLVGMKGR